MDADALSSWCGCSTGEYPWTDAGSDGNSSAEQRHYGRRYRTLLAQLNRTQEEEVLLGAEVVRTLNWLEEREAAAEKRLAALDAAARGMDGLGGPSGLCFARGSVMQVGLLAAGKAVLVRRYAQQLGRIHRDACAMLS